MTANPLVAAPTDTSTAFQGTFLLEDLESLGSAIENGSWIEGGMAVFSGVMDTVAAVSDPIGTLFAMGFGWVMEHVEPLKGWLDDLTGDADEVGAFGATWANVSTHLTSAADELRRITTGDLADMSGDAVDAYLAFQERAAKRLDAAAGFSSGMSTGMGLASMLVQMVHDMVRDALAELAGAICSYALELVLTLGAATPLIIEQATTRASALATRLSKNVTDLVTSGKNLDEIVEEGADLLRQVAREADDILGSVRSPSIDGPSVRGGDLPGSPGAHSLPDISDLKHLKDSGQIDEWAEAVADRHPTLTADEVRAIYDYTTGPGDGGATNYREMNGFLRDPSSFSPADAARIQEKIDLATSGMSKLDVSPGVQYRGTHLPQSVLDDWQVGNVVSDRAFTSSSVKPSVADNFIAMENGNAFIRIDGRSGVNVDPLSFYERSEAEILFRPGTDLKIVDREWISTGGSDGYWKFHVEEVEP